MFLSTKELEKKIISVLELAEIDFSLKDVYFNDETHTEEGLYVFCKDHAYHFVYSERGSEICHLITNTDYEITFWVIKSIIRDYVSLNYKPSQDMESTREFYFEKAKEIFNKIGENYDRLYNVYVDEMLKL